MSQIREIIAQKVEEHRDSALKIIVIPNGVMSGLFLLTMLFPSIYSMFTITANLMCLGISIILFSCFNDVFEEHTRKKALWMVKGALFQLILYILTLFWWHIGAKTEKDSIASIALFFSIISVGLFAFIVTGEQGKKAEEKLAEAQVLKGKIGEKKFTVGDVVLCNIYDEVEAGALDPREILPNKDRFLHFLILGATGTGKTSQVLIPMIHQDIQNHEAGVIVLEPKGDLAQKVKFMAEHYGREAFYFDPAMDDCPYFNPLSGREIDVVENIATTFRMLNPDSPVFFLDLSEQLVKSALKVLKRLDREENVEGATLSKLGTLLQNKAVAEGILNDFNTKCCQLGNANISESEKKENAEIYEFFMNDYWAEKSKTFENTSGIRSQVSKICSNEFLRDVLNPDYEKGQRNEIDFTKALAEGQVICLSTAQGTLRDLSRFLGLFIILQLQSAVFRRPGNENTRRSCFLYIDEFQVFSTPGFADMLTMGRSYRVASHLATQARAQMAMGGGRDGDNFVNLVSTNARNVILFPGCSYDDALYYSRQFGEKEEVTTEIGTSSKKFNLFTGGLDKLGHPTETRRETKKLVPVFTPTDLIYREFGDIVYCIIKKNSIQTPRIGKISYIPQELNTKLDDQIIEYLTAHTKKTSDELREEAKKEAESAISGLDEVISPEEPPEPPNQSPPTTKEKVFVPTFARIDIQQAPPEKPTIVPLSEIPQENPPVDEEPKATKQEDVADCLSDLGKAMEGMIDPLKPTPTVEKKKSPMDIFDF